MAEENKLELKIKGQTPEEFLTQFCGVGRIENADDADEEVNIDFSGGAE